MHDRVRSRHSEVLHVDLERELPDGGLELGLFGLGRQAERGPGLGQRRGGGISGTFRSLGTETAGSSIPGGRLPRRLRPRPARGDPSAVPSTEGTPSKNSWTASRNSAGVESPLIRTRRARPFGRPCVYQPVNVRILCSTYRIARSGADRAEVPEDQLAPHPDGRLGRVRPASSAPSGRRSTGSSATPGPIITPSHPVSRIIRSASSGVCDVAVSDRRGSTPLP